MEELFTAAMVLAGVGDGMGYKCGHWEFNYDGEQIHDDVHALGGVEALVIKKPEFMVSDDTVLLLSTAEALVAESKEGISDKLYAEVALRYKNDFANDMNGRAGGPTTAHSCSVLRPLHPNGWQIEFNSRGGGCGAAMRAMCIGLRYPNVFDRKCLENLIVISVESGRMTHNHPTGYLGSFATALFGAFSIAKVPLLKWGVLLLKLLPKVLLYVEKEGRDVEENKEAWSYFKKQWNKYLKSRKLDKGKVKFEKKYGPKERDDFYNSLSFGGWGGASGHDAPMIAYDALLFAKDNWITLCHHAMLHGGDNDSTGVIAGFCFGALYGFEGVPECNFQNVEYKARLMDAGQKLYLMACEDKYLGIPTTGDIEKTIDLLFIQE